MATKTITTEIIKGQKIATTTYRGTRYCLSRGNYGWTLLTKRLAYGGRLHMGSGRCFDSIGDVAAKCKAFGAESEISALFFGVGV